MLSDLGGALDKSATFPVASPHGVARRAAQILVGHTFLRTFSWLFDNPLYLFVIYRLGVIKGGLIMTTLSLLVCLVLLLVYERIQVDWLGVNALEAVKARGGHWVGRLYHRPLPNNPWRRPLVVVVRMVAFLPAKLFLAVLWALKRGDGFAFVALSFYEDPFITTAFLRHGRFDGFRRRDWLVFGGSVLIGNGYWVLRSCAVVEVARTAWRAISV